MGLLADLNVMIYENGGNKVLAMIIEYEWSSKEVPETWQKDRVLQLQKKPGGALIKELWNKKSLKQIAELLGRNRTDVSRQALMLGLPKKNHIFVKKPNQREYKIFDIVNLETGIFYNNCKDAAIAFGIPYRTMQGYLKGDRKNKTPFIILRNE